MKERAREEVEEREAARDNDTEEPGIMGWFTRRHKLRENQLARPTLTTRSCSELSSGEAPPAISSAVPEQIATLCFLSPRADKAGTTTRRIEEYDEEQWRRAVYPAKKLYSISGRFLSRADFSSRAKTDHAIKDTDAGDKG